MAKASPANSPKGRHCGAIRVFWHEDIQLGCRPLARACVSSNPKYSITVTMLDIIADGSPIGVLGALSLPPSRANGGGKVRSVS